MKSFSVAILGIICVVYLINPTAGLFEFLPDNLPFVGNLDEAGATALLISSLSYFGIDVKGFLGKRKDDKKKSGDAK